MEENLLGIGSRVKHPEFGVGVVIQVKSNSYVITFIEAGTKEILISYDKFEIIDAIEADSDLVSFHEIERSLIQILRKFSDIQEPVQMGSKWMGGKIILQPGGKDLKEKEIPIDAFFHKIVMVRDRLRVLEQRVNASNLNDEEKLNIQQYITRIYGSLTTFNVLFKNTSDFFVGEKTN
ncbi:MAG: hypothetical protein Q8880_04080 [Bacteroidota bacterium]|nr:hypothetical protein [Bacteroidota bacterium]